MKHTFLLICLALFSVLGVFSATIFDGRRARHMRMDSKLKALKLKSSPVDHINKFGEVNGSKRHITTLRLPDIVTAEKVRRAMQKSLNKRDEDQSNERNQWKSHPLNKDYRGPDTTEALGLNI